MLALLYAQSLTSGSGAVLWADFSADYTIQSEMKSEGYLECVLFWCRTRDELEALLDSSLSEAEEHERGEGGRMRSGCSKLKAQGCQ